jgi:fructokinase
LRPDGRPSSDRARVLGIGELLWDLFPDGPRLGGAPFNVIADVRRLGHPAAFVTAVGDDQLGRAALEAVDALGVDGTFIATAVDLTTGTVDVIPDPVGGHRFVIRSPAAYESIGDDQGLIARIGAWRPDALVFGTLAQRFAPVRELTRQVCLGARPGHRLYDVNLRDRTWDPDLVLELLGLATIVKANDDEARVLGTLLGCSADPQTLGRRLVERYAVEAVCITRGAAGAALWADGMLHEVDGIPVGVVDTVGAGDAFAAGLLHAMLEGRPAAEALAFANRLGALVASRPGALPPWQPDEIE